MGERRKGSGHERPFAGDTATFYSRFRRGYPTEFLELLVECCAGRCGRLLDLGCGTGQLALALADSFEKVEGIDPEPDMLREAEAAGCGRDIGNVHWIKGASTDLVDLEPTLGRFDLVTIGTAFHFMEPQSTLSILQRIAAGGVVAVAYSGTPMWLHPDPWARALRSVLEDRLGQLSDDDFTMQALQDAATTMHELGYTSVERWEQSRVETIDIDFIVGHILSATSPDQIPASERQEFAREVATAINKIATAGRVTETVSVRAVTGQP
jgi:ubiquinone/menaquinone biosynthesis C-methylase UbiE